MEGVGVEFRFVDAASVVTSLTMPQVERSTVTFAVFQFDSSPTIFGISEFLIYVYPELCEPGTSVVPNTVACRPCAVGEHSSEPNSTWCEACLPGTFSDAEGLTACKSCAPGQYSDSRSSISCMDCEEGLYSTGGASICTQCPEGTYAPMKASTNCSSCNANVSQSLNCKWMGPMGYWRDCSKVQPGEVCDAIPIDPEISHSDESDDCFYYGSPLGSAGVDACACAVGTFTSMRPGIPCRQCGIGMLCNESNMEAPFQLGGYWIHVPDARVGAEEARKEAWEIEWGLVEEEVVTPDANSTASAEDGDGSSEDAEASGFAEEGEDDETVDDDEDEVEKISTTFEPRIHVPDLQVAANGTVLAGIITQGGRTIYLTGQTVTAATNDMTDWNGVFDLVQFCGSVPNAQSCESMTVCCAEPEEEGEIVFELAAGADDPDWFNVFVCKEDWDCLDG